ncbi:hypothetical protein DMUE_2129, partial [Dictyocoela muelleri]
VSSLDIIFIDINATFAFLCENNIILTERFCTKCNNIARIKIYRERGKYKIIYRCTNYTCQKRIGIINTKLPLNRYMYLVYMLLSGVTYKQLNLWQLLTKVTISSVKHKVLEGASRYMNERPVLLGGLNVIVEADETAICRRGIIRNPSNTSDEVTDTVWILGAIDNTPKRNFYLQRVDDRRSTP